MLWVPEVRVATVNCHHGRRHKTLTADPPVLRNNTPIYPYAPNTQGTDECERVSPARGGHNLAVGKEEFAGTSEAA